MCFQIGMRTYIQAADKWWSSLHPVRDSHSVTRSLTIVCSSVIHSLIHLLVHKFTIARKVSELGSLEGRIEVCIFLQHHSCNFTRDDALGVFIGTALYVPLI
eukprot:GHVU01077880.1.p1 GENE.GHVU01077880.1~~GHVU01077880.1.p1  ORF type:complete len:102 (-),score=1.40 GHVU01077880.1:325-630(-)